MVSKCGWDRYFINGMYTHDGIEVGGDGVFVFEARDVEGVEDVGGPGNHKHHQYHDEGTCNTPLLPE